MIIRLTIVALCSILISCSSFRKPEILTGLALVDDTVSNKIEINGDMLVFCKSSNVDKPIASAPLMWLIKDYVADSVNHKMDKDFKSYISDIYDFKIEYFNNDKTCFKLNDSISRFYKTNGFEIFLDSVVKNKNSEIRFRLKNEDDNEKLQTIMYYLYKNDYYCYNNEYLGGVTCVKIADFKNRLMNIVATEWYPLSDKYLMDKKAVK